MKFRSIFIYCVIAIAIATSGCVSSQQLEQLSADQFEQMRTEVPVSNEPADREFVNCVAEAIIDELPAPYSQFDWDMEVFAEEAVNAFAMPGGKIGVYDGIFKVAPTQDELAAVIGHEIAHVTLEHSLDRANREIITRGGIAIGAQVFGVSGAAADAIAMGAEFGLLRPYGREQESQADFVGLDYMARAGFNPEAAVTLWQNMAANSEGSPPQWMSTHPSNTTRINALSGALEQVTPLYQQARSSGRRPNCRR